MHDLPSSTLLQQLSARPKGGEELEVLGKEAASKYIKGDCDNLNEAVVETVKDAGLSPEHVKRVVEFANTDAYLQEFRKEGQDHRVIEFRGGPANFSEILKDLNDGGGGTVFDKGDADYQMPPPDTVKTSMANRERLGMEEEKLAEALSVEDAPIPYADPFADSQALKEKLASLYDHLSTQLSGLETYYYDAGDRLYNQVKQAALSGTTLGQIVKAWQTVTDNPEFVKAAFAEMTPRLLGGEVFRSKGAIGESLTKTASSGMVNPNHPLVQDFEEYCSSLDKLAEVRAVQEEVAKNLDVISTFMKQAAAGKAIGMVPKAVKAVTGATARAAPRAARAAEVVGGKGFGKAVGFGVKYSPHLAAGVAAEELYQRMRWHPEVQSVKNMILSRIPHTQPYMVRQHAIMRRMY